MARTHAPEYQTRKGWKEAAAEPTTPPPLHVSCLWVSVGTRGFQELEALKRDRTLLEHSVRESTRMITASMTLMGELQLELSGAHATAAGPESLAGIKQQVWGQGLPGSAVEIRGGVALCFHHRPCARMPCTNEML
jgi:hypothetical protein